MADMPASLSRDRWDEAAIRAALARVLASAAFARGRRARELLLYLVEEVLAGRGEAISEHSVAQDVFGRDQTYDPSLDSCARTEIWRLRNRLRKYYAEEGLGDPVRIDFRPRSIAPEFRRCTDGPIAEQRKILIDVSSANRSGPGSSMLVTDLAEEIARGLRHVPGVAPYIESSGRSQTDLRLRCRVSTEGSDVRVVTSLVDQKTGAVRAAEAFSRPLGSVDLTSPRIGEVVVQMTADSLAGALADLPVDLLNTLDRCRYVDSVLRGPVEHRSQRLAEVRAIVNYHQRLIDQDSKDKLAHRRLVGALGLFLLMVPSATMHILPALVGAAHATLALDAMIPDVWLGLGLAYSYARDWDAAERSYRKAISADPLNTAPYVFLAYSYLQMGRINSALEAAMVALELDPTSSAAASSYGLALNHARRFNEAEEVALRALAIDPRFTRLRMILGDSRMQLGNLDGAIEDLRVARDELWQDSLASGILGLAYARGGERELARSVLADLERPHALNPRDPLAEALVHIGLGSFGNAIQSLSEAVRRRGTPGLFIQSGLFDPIRSADGFRALERGMGLPFA